MIPTTRNDSLLKTIWGEPVDRTPIWVMRQAGRYLPEYRAVRAQAGSFMKLCQTPELACEVTLQPLNRYDLDAAIIFSDILTIPDAMGLGLSFTEGQGPSFSQPLRTVREIERLSVPDLNELRYVYDAILLTQAELAGRLPLIGFCGSPFTLAAYMVEGRSNPGFPLLFKMLKEEPKALHQLLMLLAQAVSAHLNAQIAAGVEVVMIFDTWGGLLNTQQYEIFSLYYLKEVTARLLKSYNDKKIPVILFTKGGSQWLDKLAAAGGEVLGLDWEISLAAARKQVGKKVALQGNLNPACLLNSPEDIRANVLETLRSYGTGSGHVFNLGHGITPDVPPEHMGVLVEAVHELSVPFHQGKG